MKVLLDTHVLLWAAGQTGKLSRKTRALLDNQDTVPLFSPASLWEICIKQGLGREDFQVDPRQLCRGLLDNGYGELAVTSAHALAVSDLPALHPDPFDRLLLAQSRVEGIPLLTADEQVLRYAGSVMKA